MYVVKKFATPLLLTKFLRGGDTVFSGAATLTTDGTTTLTDNSATDLTDTDNVSVAVAAGMGVYIGDGGAASGSESTVASVAGAASGVITLTDDIGVASEGTSYRIVADGERHHTHGASRDVVHVGFDSLSSTWVVIYDAGADWSNG